MNTQTHAAAVQPAAIVNRIPAIVPAAGRAMISTILILSGFSKLAAPAMTMGYIQSVGLPLPIIAFGLSAFVGDRRRHRVAARLSHPRSGWRAHIDRVVSFDGVGEAHRALEAGETMGRVVLQI